MSRTKEIWKIKLDSVGGLIWSEPIDSESETVLRGVVPMIEATMPDGRRVFLSFEASFRDGTSTEEYIRRMRLLAATLTNEADLSEKKLRGV